MPSSLAESLLVLSEPSVAPGRTDAEAPAHVKGQAGRGSLSPLPSTCPRLGCGVVNYGPKGLGLGTSWGIPRRKRHQQELGQKHCLSPIRAQLPKPVTSRKGMNKPFVISASVSFFSFPIPSFTLTGHKTLRIFCP